MKNLRRAGIRVCIVYPADPVGVIPGGIDTFIRGELAYAPDDIEYTLVGITTDPESRPVGRWTRCHVGDREFSFFPVREHSVSHTLPLIPFTVQFMAALRQMPLFI